MTKGEDNFAVAIQSTLSDMGKINARIGTIYTCPKCKDSIVCDFQEAKQ
jgi:hypothetical protein